MTIQTFTTARSIRQIERIKNSLSEAPMTRAQLCGKLYLSIQTVCNYLQYLMKKPRQIRISGYAPTTRGRLAPIYALGSGRDAVEPPRKTSTQFYRELQADPEKHEVYLARNRARAMAARVRRKPSTWLSALGAP